jgi:hypothetical protein
MNYVDVCYRLRLGGKRTTYLHQDLDFDDRRRASCLAASGSPPFLPGRRPVCREHRRLLTILVLCWMSGFLMAILQYRRCNVSSSVPRPSRTCTGLLSKRNIATTQG